MKLGNLIIVLLIVSAICTYILSGWTESNLEFWLSLIKGEFIDVPFGIAVLVTFIGNGFIIVFNIVTELLKLILI